VILAVLNTFDEDVSVFVSYEKTYPIYYGERYKMGMTVIAYAVFSAHKK
jgi:hypothetical protein